MNSKAEVPVPDCVVMTMKDANDLFPDAWLHGLYNVASHCTIKWAQYKEIAIDRFKSQLIGKVCTILADAVAKYAIDENINGKKKSRLNICHWWNGIWCV